MSCDQASISPINCQGIISILRHVGWFGISVKKYVDPVYFQLLGLYAKYLCSRAHSVARPSARDDWLSCIQLLGAFRNSSVHVE